MINNIRAGFKGSSWQQSWLIRNMLENLTNHRAADLDVLTSGGVDCRVDQKSKKENVLIGTLLRLLLRTMRTQWCCLKRALEDSLKVVWNPSWLLCQNFKIYLCDCRSIQLLQTSKLRFGSLATPPFITARFQFIVLINCKTQQIKFELKYLPQMVFKMVGIDRKTIPIKYRAFQGKYKIWGIHICLNITTIFGIMDWNFFDPKVRWDCPLKWAPIQGIIMDYYHHYHYGKIIVNSYDDDWRDKTLTCAPTQGTAHLYQKHNAPSQPQWKPTLYTCKHSILITSTILA